MPEVRTEVRVFIVSYFCDQCGIEVIYVGKQGNEFVHTCTKCKTIYRLKDKMPYELFVPDKEVKENTPKPVSPPKPSVQTGKKKNENKGN